MLWHKQSSDAVIVRNVLSGRHDQFEVSVERHLPQVLAIAGARVGNRADADDAAQEAFLKAYTSLDTRKDHARFTPWLAAIVRNVCATLQRIRREVDRLDPEALIVTGKAIRMDTNTLQELARAQTSAGGRFVVD